MTQIARPESTAPPPASHSDAARIQEPFLNNLRKMRRTVVIYLINGVKLAGRITSFDQHTVALDGHERQVINKHAIATIMPAPPRAPARKPRDPSVVRRNHLGLPIKSHG
ncbi:MAG: RNA chaperone Hfq [Burkholderiales bacterium]|nr:RNA chaperone Hfq [Burkholderiales bacterium]